MAQRGSFGPTVAGFVLVCANATELFCQSYYGSLRGTVLDPRDASVASAKVTLLNEGTDTQRSTVSSSSGEYVFSEVVPAAYSLTVESPGFKKFERKGIVVGTQQQISLNLKIEVGQVSESVQVTEEAPLVESASASQG